MEALAVGKPVVAADHGASAELFIEGETGWLFKPGDPDSLARALEVVLGLETGARENLAERAISNVRSNFTKELMCAKTLEVYSEVLTEASAKAYGRT